MTPTSIGMWFFLQRSPNFFQRIGFSLRMNGVRSEFNRAEVGSTMLSTVLSHTSCSSGGPSTISSSWRIRPNRTCLPNKDAALFIPISMTQTYIILFGLDGLGDRVGPIHCIKILGFL